MVKVNTKRLFGYGLLLLALLLAGCGGEKAQPAGGEGTKSMPHPPEEGAGNLYQTLAEQVFVLRNASDHAETRLAIDENGILSGHAYDFILSEEGDGYPDGTLYSNDFTAALTDAREIQDGIYEMKMGPIQYKNTPGTEKIEDGTRYVYSEAYGLEDTDELLLYLPDTPITELPQEYLDWVTLSHFRGEDGQGDPQMPETLPFFGLYNPAAGTGFFSEPATGMNRMFIGNHARFPGLMAQRAELREDGTYYYTAMDTYGMELVVNLCFPAAEAPDPTADREAFAEACVEHMLPDSAVSELYVFGEEEMEWQPDLVTLDGQPCYYAFWQQGGAEDTRSCSAKILVKDGFVYVYGVSCSQYDELMRGEAEAFFLSSLFINEAPAVLPPGGMPDAVVTITAYVKPDPDTAGALLADEFLFISGDDSEMLKEYGLTEEDITNDYAIVGDNGEYQRYILREYAPLYTQRDRRAGSSRPEDHENILPQLNNLPMVLYLDTEDQIVFAYEPYLP